MITLYGYASSTNEYIGTVTPDKNPAGSGYLFPAFCTPLAPPPFSVGQIPVFKENTWVVEPDFRGQIWYTQDTARSVTVEALGDPSTFNPPLVQTRPFVTPPFPKDIPDNPTLGDWRVALALWPTTDAQGNPTTWLAIVNAEVQALVSSGHPLGQVILQRLEFSNNVKRIELLQLMELFTFNQAMVDESLKRAYVVSLGDLNPYETLPSKYQ